MQAIHTSFIAPTNTRGSRIVAKCAAGRIVVPWDDAQDVEDNHQRAAQALVAKLGGRWPRRAAPGCLPDGSMVWVPVEASSRLRTINNHPEASGL